MEKNIWVIDQNREELIQIQRKVNESGGLRAVCLTSVEAVKKAMNREGSMTLSPSMVLIDFATASRDDFLVLHLLKQKEGYAGVPRFFLEDTNRDITREEYYERGASVVIGKPLNDSGLLRIEQMAMQYEQTKNYERLLQKQMSELRSAREITRLNEQLKNRNELLHRAFGRYFPDDVVQVILEDPEATVVGGEKRVLPVLMADLRGFTAITETLAPDQVTNMLNHFLENMISVITECHGTIIEFLGDAILAVFGAPLAIDKPIFNSLTAAVRMQNAMGKVNEYNLQKDFPPIEMGIGIHAGDVFIGNIGSSQMMRYNVIGKAVNTASRIESYSVGGQILVSQETIDAMDCQVELKSIIDIKVKGLREPISVCDITGIVNHCHLNQKSQEIWTEVKETVDVWVCPLKNKQLSRTVYKGELRWLSAKSCTIEMPTIKLELYEDCQVLIRRQDSEPIYGKVVKTDETAITLRLTYVTRNYMEFYYEQRREG